MVSGIGPLCTGYASERGVAQIVRIAVDDRLGPVKQRLRAGGYEVISLAGGVPRDIAAVVVNGLDDNIMGQQNALVAVPIINAEGRTAEEVAADVGQRIDVWRHATPMD